MTKLTRRRFLLSGLAALTAALVAPLSGRAGFTVLYVLKSGSCGRPATATALTEAMLTESWYTIILPPGADVTGYAVSLAVLECETVYLPVVLSSKF